MGKNRTYLFVPGNRPERVVKAFNSKADAVIIDLEDAVAISEKEATRTIVRQQLDLPHNGRAYVRVNSFQSKYTENDIAAVVCKGLHGIVLPMTETAADVISADRLMKFFEERQDLPVGKIDLMPLVETCKGVWNIEEILTQSPRVKRVAFGAGDFSLDMNIEWSKDGTERLYAQSRLVLASRALGAEPPIDTVFPDVKDMDGLIREAKIGRQLGFQGKLLIHPAQIDPVNEIFSPSAEQISFAKEVVAAFEEAERNGIAAFTVRGKFIDYPILYMSRKVLSEAE